MKIKQLQKNKIEWREVELGDILDYEQPTNYIVESTDYKKEYETPVLTAGKSFILGYTDETNGIYDKLPVIIFDDFTTDKKFVDFKFKVKSSAMKILRPKNKLINLKFVFLAMQRLKFDAKRHKRYYLSAYQNLRIPLPFLNGKPDLETQKKIVEILDKVEKLKQKRSEADKLTKEYLQSVFYKMFYNKGFEEVELGEITENLDSKRIPLSQVERVKIRGKVPYYGACEIVDYIRDFIFNEDLLLIGEDGQNLVSRNKPMAFIIKGKSWVNNHAHVLRLKNNSNIEYLRFYLNFIDYSPYISGSTQPKLNQAKLSKIKIPFPPLPLQQKFASIVEHVEKLKEKQKKSQEEIGVLFNSLMQKAFNGELI